MVLSSFRRTFCKICFFLVHKHSKWNISNRARRFHNKITTKFEHQPYQSSVVSRQICSPFQLAHRTRRPCDPQRGPVITKVKLFTTWYRIETKPLIHTRLFQHHQIDAGSSLSSSKIVLRCGKIPPCQIFQHHLWVAVGAPSRISPAKWGTTTLESFASCPNSPG